MMKLNKIVRNTAMLCLLLGSFNIASTRSALGHSVCGLRNTVASFRTAKRLITICPGEASYQMILTFPDGTGYQKIPVERRGKRFNGSDGRHNYVIDKQTFVIGTDGKPPIRQAVTQSRFSP